MNFVHICLKLIKDNFLKDICFFSLYFSEYSQFRQPYHVYSIHEGICHFPANLADMNINNVTLNNQCFLLDSKGYLALGMHAKSDTLYFSTNNTDKWINRVRMEYDAPLENIVGGVGIVQGK